MQILSRSYFRRIPRSLLVIFIIAIFSFTALIAYRIISGKSIGIIGFIQGQIYEIQNYSNAIINSSTTKSSGSGDFTNVVFLHHSTGANLIEQGRVRDIMIENGIDFWDHGYNEIGLRGPDGSRLSYNYHIPDDNTNPGGFYKIFQQTELPLPVNAFSGLLQHDVIVLKSCFRPANNIRSDEQLNQYKTWYLEMRSVMSAHPEKIFILVTVPPLNPSETDQAEGSRARKFAEWLMSDEYLSGYPNIFTFDYFSYLAINDSSSPEFNMLRSDFREGNDSHPNQLANETLGPVFAQFIIDSIKSYQSTAPVE